MNNPILFIRTLCVSIPCTLSLSIQVDAQPGSGGDPNQPAVSLSALPPVTLHLSAVHPAICAGSDQVFGHFEVIDLRPDTARIGVHTNIPAFGRPHDRQLIFRRSAAIELADYLNRHFTTPGSPLTALIILRSLWLTDANYIREEMVRDPDRRFEKTHIRFKAEIYAVRDNRYLPVLRFDTLQATKKTIYYSTLQSPYSDWNENLVAIVDELADSCSRVVAQKKDQGHWIGIEEIRQFNASRFETPIGNSIPLVRGYMPVLRNSAIIHPPSRTSKSKWKKTNGFFISGNPARLTIHTAPGVIAMGRKFLSCVTGCSVRLGKKEKPFISTAIATTGTPEQWQRRSRPRIWQLRLPHLRFPAAVTASVPASRSSDCRVPASGGITTGHSAPIGTLAASPRISDYKQRFIYSIDMDTGAIY